MPTDLIALAVATVLAILPLVLLAALAGGFALVFGEERLTIVRGILLIEASFLAVAGGHLLVAGNELSIPLSVPSLVGVLLALSFTPLGFGFAELHDRIGSKLGLTPETGDFEDASLPALVIVALFLVGPAEELLYRAIVQELWIRETGAVAGVVLANALFGLVHFPTYGADAPGDIDASVVFGMLGTALFGMYLGVLYLYTGTLLVPILAHSLYVGALFVRNGRY